MKASLDRSKIFWTAPNFLDRFGHGSKDKIQWWEYIFGLIQNSLDRSKTIWSGPNKFGLVQNYRSTRHNLPPLSSSPRSSFSICVKMNGERKSCLTFSKVSLWQIKRQRATNRVFQVAEKYGNTNSRIRIPSGHFSSDPTKPNEKVWNAIILGRT